MQSPLIRNSKSFILISSFIFLFSAATFSQTVFEPIQSSVYNFLDIMAQKGIIVFNDIAKPVTRKYIAEKLQQLKSLETENPDSANTILTPLEINELNFYLKDYGIELSFIENSKSKIQNSTTLVNWDQFDRWRMFSYNDSLFTLSASPILGYQAGKRDGAKYSHSWNGLYLYGYIAGKVGYSLKFNDNSETGTTIDPTKSFSPVTGISISKANNNNIQYDEVEADISTDWSWGDITVAKDYLNWGYGQSGLLVLSDKTPSFPFIRLDIQPVKWLRFNYIHAWLNSNVIDSSAFYSSHFPNEPVTTFRNKFFVSHSITVTPTTGLDVSVGESMIYPNQIQIPYLIPIMFFRLADHYLSQNNNSAGGNASMFFGVSSRNQLKNTHLYGTLFIDEFTIQNMFNSQLQHFQIGFTLGGSITDLPIPNLTATAEFTKIYPGVYTHFIPTLTYQSDGYNLGDWMGNNADRIYGALNYRFIRGLQATVWAQYIRKGATATADQQYNNPQPPFLFGLRTDYTYLGAELKYEITHELYADLQLQTTKTNTQQPNLSYTPQTLNEFYISLYYGIH